MPSFVNMADLKGAGSRMAASTVIPIKDQMRRVGDACTSDTSRAISLLDRK